MNRTVEIKVRRVRMERRHRRMVGHLFAQNTKIGSLQFECFAQQRIERFAQSFPIRGQRRHSKSCRKECTLYSLKKKNKKIHQSYRQYISCDRLGLLVRMQPEWAERTPCTRSCAAKSLTVRWKWRASWFCSTLFQYNFLTPTKCWSHYARTLALATKFCKFREKKQQTKYN